MNQLIHPDCHPFTAAGTLKQVSAFYEEGRRVMWMMLRAQPRPCFNHELIDEIMTLARAAKDSGLPIDFWVTGSLVPQIYNCLLYTSPSPRDRQKSRMPSSA